MQVLGGEEVLQLPNKTEELVPGILSNIKSTACQTRQHLVVTASCLRKHSIFPWLNQQCSQVEVGNMTAHSVLVMSLQVWPL